jgi:hypothetical protein
MENMLDHYRAVLADLEQRRSRIQSELRDVDETITRIRRLMSTQTTLFASAPTSGSPIVAVSQSRYTGMSVRWAILCLLAEDAPTRLGTGEIAQILKDGGITSNSQNFSSNVSAVLSVMSNSRGEVEQVEGAYQITTRGRDVWNGIKLTAQYRNRLASPDASVQ